MIFMLKRLYGLAIGSNRQIDSQVLILTTNETDIDFTTIEMISVESLTYPEAIAQLSKAGFVNVVSNIDSDEAWNKDSYHLHYKR